MIKHKILLTLAVLLIPMLGFSQFNLGSVQDLKFYSKSLNHEARMRVYLPPGYNPDNPVKKYPVIISLHGASVGYEVYDFMYPIVDGLWLSGSIDHFILVMPDGLAPPFNGSFYTNSDLYGNYEDMISEDIVPYIDSAYHTYGKREFRAMMGHSMGAYGAFKQVFKHPHLYCAVSSHSGPVHIEMLDMLVPDVMAENGDPPYNWQYTPGKGLTNLIFTMAGAFSPNPDSDILVDFPISQNGELLDTVLDRWNEHNIVEMVRWYSPLADTKIFFDCGAQDQYYLNLHNKALSDSLSLYGIEHEYTEYQGDHTSGLVFRVPIAFLNIDKVFKGNHTKVRFLNLPEKEIVKIYPNPTRGLLYYEPKNPTDLERITLSGLDGRIVDVFKPTENPINLESIDPGIYVAFFHFKRSVSGFRIVKID